MAKIRTRIGNIQGPPGEPGAAGAQGPAGEPGYTPVKGKDYFDGAQGPQGPQGPAYSLTDADKNTIAAAVKASLTTETMTYTYEDGSTRTVEVYVK